MRRGALRGDDAEGHQAVDEFAALRASLQRLGVIQEGPAWHLGCGHAMGQQKQIPGQLSCGRPLPVGSSRNSTRKPVRYWSFSARKRLKLGVVEPPQTVAELKKVLAVCRPELKLWPR